MLAFVVYGDKSKLAGQSFTYIRNKCWPRKLHVLHLSLTTPSSFYLE